MKIDYIIITEPERVDSFYPFSIMHCIWEIRCGCFRLFEKIKNTFPDSRLFFSGRAKHISSFIARESIENSIKPDSNWLIINPTYLISEKQWNEFFSNYQNPWKEREIPALITSGNDIIAVYLPAEYTGMNDILLKKVYSIRVDDELFTNFQKYDVGQVKHINYIWDAIKYNGAEIQNDSIQFENIYNHSGNFKSEGIYLINGNKILVGDNVSIMPQSVLDASEGNIIIGNNVRIMPQSVIIGPCYIGDNTIVKIGSKIYKDSSFGQWSKIGGEIESTIIHSYSNKQHDGFLGNSYICEWVNLGAGTNNSNLKNTYSNIKIRLEKEEVDTGTMFLGLICGDHTKTAIGTKFNTGTIVGICGILFYDGFHPNFIPSYSWGGRKDSPRYKLSKAIEITRIVMERRGKILTEEEIELMTEEYNKAL